MSLENISPPRVGRKSPIKLLALIGGGLLVILLATLFTGGEDQPVFKAPAGTHSSSRGITQWSDATPAAIPSAREVDTAGLDPVRVGAMLVGVLILIAGGALTLRSVMKKARLMPSGKRHLKLLDALAIGPKRFVYLVSMEDHLLVLGAGGEHVELLAEYEREEAASAASLKEAAAQKAVFTLEQEASPEAPPESATHTSEAAAGAKTPAVAPIPAKPTLPLRDQIEKAVQATPPAAAPESSPIAPAELDMVPPEAAFSSSLLDLPTGMLTMPPVPPRRGTQTLPPEPNRRQRPAAAAPPRPTASRKASAAPQAIRAYQAPAVRDPKEPEVEGAHRVPKQFRHLLQRAMSENEG